ncbi:MAG TPA: pyridoxal phosphate-dependent aminotransferase [Elusimicrobiota bacterium]|nr:pyridoxal phosphate-dependent aminotransferase [Elusimicrobiota bacterium]
MTDLDQAMSIKFNTMVYELRRQGKSVIVLSLGEPYFDVPLESFDPLPYPAVLHYSHSRGIPELRQRLARYYQDHFGVPVDPEREILVTAGSKVAIYMALLSILAPGDEVLIPEPGWVSYPAQIRLGGGVPVPIPHDTALQDYVRYVTPRTKALMVTSPHNPRGYAYSVAELNALRSLAERHNFWLFGDEAYSEFVPEGRFRSIGRDDPQKSRTVLFNSISKNFGISGWRLGYVIARSDLVDLILKVNQHLITCPATILEYYVAHYFDSLERQLSPQVQKLVTLRGAVDRALADRGLRAMPGNSTFYFFVSIEPSHLGSEEFCRRLLLEESVCLVPGIGYGASCDRYVRLSIGTATLDEIVRGIERMKSLIERTRR